MALRDGTGHPDEMRRERRHEGMLPQTSQIASRFKNDPGYWFFACEKLIEDLISRSRDQILGSRSPAPKKAGPLARVHTHIYIYGQRLPALLSGKMGFSSVIGFRQR
jgi:hypothetical protein